MKHTIKNKRARRAAAVAALALSAALLYGTDARAWTRLQYSSGTREFDVTGSAVNGLISGFSASDGGAAYLTGSGARLRLYGDGDLTVQNNSATNRGGAFRSYGTLTIDINGALAFLNNTAGNPGGAIIASSGTVSLAAKEITFSYNKTTNLGGGAIFSTARSFGLTAQDNITFMGNSAGTEGGAIKLDNNAALALAAESVSFANNSSGAGGGAIKLENNAALALAAESVTFANNSGYNMGGALYISNGGSAKLNVKNDLIFTGNIVKGNGGGVRTGEPGSALIATAGNIVFSDNKAFANPAANRPGYGGGARNYRASQTYYASGAITFSGNRAEDYGGGVYVDGGGGLAGTTKFFASGDITFEGNTTNQFGGGVATEHSSGMGDVSHVVTLESDSNITFTGNSSGANSATAPKDGGGGAFYIDSYAEAVVPGVEVDHGSIVASGDITFKGNHADNNADITQGGAVYAGGVVSIDAGGDLTFDGNYINTAESGQGGAIAVVLGGSLYLGEGRTQNVVLTNNHVSGDKADDAAVLQGGAVYIARGGLHINALNKIELTDNYAHSCHALAAGGAVYVGGADGAASLVLAAPLIEMTGNHVASARDDDDGHTAKGGALFNENGDITVTAAHRLNVSGNYAHATTTAWGGAVNVHAGSLTVNVRDAQVSGNSVTADGAPDAQNVTARGGAMFAAGGAITWNTAGTTTFARNSAVNLAPGGLASGGAVGTEGDVTFAGGHVVFDQNESSAPRGSAFGALVARDGHLTADVKSARFSANAASGDRAYGGALTVNGGAGTLIAPALTFDGNTAAASGIEARGGAIIASGDATTLTVSADNARFTGNAVRAENGSARGGAAFAGGTSTWNVSGELRFEDNSVTGGAFAAGSAMSAVGTATFNGGQVLFANGTSKADDGSAFGALNVNGGHFVADVEKLTFSGNTAEGTAAHGGALALNGGTGSFTAQSLLFERNTVTAAGEAAFGGAILASGDTAELTVRAEQASFTGNAAASAAGTARGGAVFAGGTSTWNVTDELRFENNSAAGATFAGGSALSAAGTATFAGGHIIFADNTATASEGEAYGALTVNGGHLVIGGSAGASLGVQFDGNAATGTSAFGAGASVRGGDAQVDSRTVNFADNTAAATAGEAHGGGLYSDGALSFTAEKTLTFERNKAVSTGGVSRGGAAFAEGDITIVIGDGTDPGTALFSGNEATLGGALYSESGHITLANNGIRSAKYDFATATDDVYAAGGSIAIGCRLVAKPGTSFTASGAFTLGEEPGDSVLTVAGARFTENANERDPGDLTIFGGAEINFNQSHLDLYNMDEIEQPENARTGFAADVATVMFPADPGLIPQGAASADITGQDWALDVSDYRNARLYIHSAVKQSGAEIDAIKANLSGFENAYVAKLSLMFDRYSLIWRGLDDTWDESNSGHTPWVLSSSGDIFTPFVTDDLFVPEAFYRGDIVVFDGNVYDESLSPANVRSADGTVNVPVEKFKNILAVSPSDVYVTGGSYTFVAADDLTGGIAAERLFVRSGSDGTCSGIVQADFTGTPVKVWEAVSVDVNTQVSFDIIATLDRTPVEIAGSVAAASPSLGGWTVYDGGSLTLEGGSGALNSLTLERGATLKVGTLGAYQIAGSFAAKDGSHTIVTPKWAPGSGINSNAILSGTGEAQATVADGARLTILGIDQGATGTWTLLDNFQKGVTAKDNAAWGNIEAGTLSVTGYKGLVASADAQEGDYAYEVKKTADNKGYVLVIAQKKTEQPQQEEEVKDLPLPPIEKPEKPQSQDYDPGTGPTEPTEPDEPVVTPERPGHTEVFHIAGSVQRALSRAAIEPRPKEHLWAHFWRDSGRVYDTTDKLALKTRAYGVILGRDLSKDYKKTWGLAAHIGKGDTKGKGSWDGSTSDTNFWGLMVYGRRDERKWFFTGDASFNWFKTDYTEANGSSADNARSTMFSVGGRAYYKWIDNPQPGQMSVHPFIGARWNYYRQSGYTYDTGNESRAWKSGQLHVPMGIKIQWGEMESKDGWHVTPTLEASYIRTIGQRSAVTGIHAPGQARSGVRMPLSARDTFAAEFRYVTRNEKKGFHWELNAGVRRSTSEKDLHVGTTFKWEL